MSKIIEVSKQKNKYARTWYNLHRQELQEVVVCDVCGKSCKVYSLGKHLKTQYHLQHMKMKTTIDELKKQLIAIKNNNIK
jgi:hypothetical protein